MTQGRRGNSSGYLQSPLSWEAGLCILSPKSFLWVLLTQSPTVLCPHISFPIQKQHPESIFLFPSLLSLSSSWLRNWGLLFFQSKRKRLRKMKVDWFLFFSFFMWRKWDEKWKCNGLPAFNSYPLASYISKAATSVPFKWSLLLYFVHIRFKLWWMLYRSYSVIRPKSRQFSWDIRSSDDLSLS